MPLRLYNTLTKKEEEFTPIKPSGEVTFYSCGPTVYDYAHIGNFRSFLNADVLRRTLELLGHRVRHVMNITDVGHMTDDANADGGGEDKMAAAGRRLLEQKKSGKLPADAKLDPSNPYAIADFYADAFLEDARTLGLKIALDLPNDPEARKAVMPRPTQFIEPMIAMVQRLIERGHAYVAGDGVVYFDVQTYPEYGRLSGNTPDSVRAGEGGRVDEANQAKKKHPADFMLWKPDAKHVMKWPSPWGEGYPGWHLECSVMARALLGDEIDLHSGGEDNIFPHHECEIAQTCCATGHKLFSRYWFHTRHLIVEGEKMSKSKGNFFTVRDLLAKGASPAAIRLEIIKTHYRSNANFTMQGLADSQRMIDRWVRLKEWLEKNRGLPTTQFEHERTQLRSAFEAFTSSLCDDLSVASAIGWLNVATNEYSSALSCPIPSLNYPSDDGDTFENELQALARMDSVLGVLSLATTGQASHDDLDVSLIETKIANRLAARQNKDFARADELRKDLAAMGIEIKDGPQGTTWTRMVK